MSVSVELADSGATSVEKLSVEDESLLETALPWYRNSNQRILVIMAFLTFGFCVAEFLFGIIANSLALMSDAFHMLSDLISLIVGFIAITLARRVASTNKSYGWIRAEVLGGLVNGVFLIAVCFFIILEAIQRFMEPPDIDDPMIVIIVGSAGLGMNLVGLLLFSAHSSMEGGGGGHSHGHGGGGGHSHGHGHAHKNKGKEHEEHEGEHKEEKKGGNANLHAVFLHVLGDALGSVGAVASGLIIKFVHHDSKFYADPILSLVLAAIILKSSIPLVKHCTNILMQGVPENIELETMKETLVQIAGVLSVHDLHVWQLSDTKNIATLHITVQDSADFANIAATIKDLFHKHGVHNITIQPEYVADYQGDKNKKLDCQIVCTTPECSDKMCCSTKRHTKKTIKDKNAV